VVGEAIGAQKEKNQTLLPLKARWRMKKLIVQGWISLYVIGMASQLLASGVDGIGAINPAVSNKNIEIRHYTYPPDYMHREPVLNYPERTYFSYGKTGMSPSAGAIKERGLLTNYWHLTDLEPVSE
jgi:hypothetical protein